MIELKNSVKEISLPIEHVNQNRISQIFKLERESI